MIAALRRDWGAAQANYDAFRFFSGLHPSEESRLSSATTTASTASSRSPRRVWMAFSATRPRRARIAGSTGLERGHRLRNQQVTEDSRPHSPLAPPQTPGSATRRCHHEEAAVRGRSSLAGRRFSVVLWVAGASSRLRRLVYTDHFLQICNVELGEVNGHVRLSEQNVEFVGNQLSECISERLR